MGRSVETVNREAGGVIFIDCSYMYQLEIEYSCECGWEDYSYDDKETTECPECGRDDLERTEHEPEGQYMWQDLVENIVGSITDHFKSFDEPAKSTFLGGCYREQQLILENYHCQISISEYCGCGAISVFEDDCAEYPELALWWTNQNFEKIQELCKPFTDQMRRIATASNGEAFYEKV
jgi:predicted RNA-binding Zn-ribbon protein involved in translation (DUF1610 family)